MSKTAMAVATRFDFFAIMFDYGENYESLLMSVITFFLGGIFEAPPP